MTVIVCLDNANGMLFNHRRQSRDANVVKDILKTINGASLCSSVMRNTQRGVCAHILPDTASKTVDALLRAS